MFLVNVNTLTFKRSPTYIICTEAEYTLPVTLRTRQLNLTSVMEGKTKGRQQTTFHPGVSLHKSAYNIKVYYCKDLSLFVVYRLKHTKLKTLVFLKQYVKG